MSQSMVSLRSLGLMSLPAPTFFPSVVVPWKTESKTVLPSATQVPPGQYSIYLDCNLKTLGKWLPLKVAPP